MPYRNRLATSGNVILRLLLALLVLILIAAAAYGTFIWREHKVSSLTDQINSLKAQLQTNKQGAPSNQSSSSSSQQAPSTSQPSSPSPSSATSYTSDKGVKVIVYTPANNAKVSNPLGVLGEVPGSWSFEASFPILLEDSSGGVIAQGTAQVLGNWMTDQLVPFSAKLTYSGTPSGSGKLVLQKDNPSGQAQNADTVSIPVQM